MSDLFLSRQKTGEKIQHTKTGFQKEFLLGFSRVTGLYCLHSLLDKSLHDPCSVLCLHSVFEYKGKTDTTAKAGVAH